MSTGRCTTHTPSASRRSSTRSAARVRTETKLRSRPHRVSRRTDTGEWEGERTVEALRQVTDGVDCPFVLESDQRENVRDWMEYADRYGVFERPPIADERLFP
ncbi:hypothetical protein D8S78_23395 [Natrialba swarupiae]|nr:hypothetical protein [Natrialba swarupiae]